MTASSRNRNAVSDGIVLRNNRIGEIHKGLTLFTPENGLVSAVAYGAFSQKGKLRGVTNIFCYGTCYLYTDHSKQTNKLSDIHVKEFFHGLREDIAKFYIASLWAEAVLKSFGGGVSARELFALLLEALRLLDTCPAARADRLLVLFLWKYLDELGSAPDLTRAHYGLSGGAVRYLSHAGRHSLGESFAVGIDDASVNSMKGVLFDRVEELIEKPLNTLRIGQGIL
jgi:DNA repair protein RecO